MAKQNVYIYEDGECRMDHFVNKSIVKAESFFDMIDEGRKKIKDDEAFDEFLDDVSDQFDYDTSSALAALVTGCNFDNESTRKINKRIKDLKEGKPVYVELEESTIGYAFSKREAREICLAHITGEDW